MYAHLFWVLIVWIFPPFFGLTDGDGTSIGISNLRSILVFWEHLTLKLRKVFFSSFVIIIVQLPVSKNYVSFEYQPFVLFTLSMILHNLLYLLFIRLIIFSCIVHIVNENIYLSALIFKTGDMYSINLYDNKNESLSKNVGKIVILIINSKVDP